MRCSNHDTCITLIIACSKRKCRNWHQCIIDTNLNSVSGENGSSSFGKNITFNTAIVADGNRLVTTLCLYPVGETLCSLTYYIDVHTVSSGSKNTSKAGSSKLQCNCKTVFNLVIISLDTGKLRMKITIFKVSSKPAFVLV